MVPSIFGENFMDDFFEDWKRPMRSMVEMAVPRANIMRTDVKETDTAYELKVDLPGYKKEDIQAEIKDGSLTITASKKTETEEKDDEGRYIRRERFVGNCSRSFFVGDDIEQDDIKASFEDGILTVVVPKHIPEPVVEEKKYITIE